MHHPTSHKLNADGYFRKQVWYEGRLQNMMYYRYVWLRDIGDIPDGYEIDHLCRNRACCNINHLNCIEGSLHASKSNSDRYADRRAKGISLLNSGKTKRQVADELGVTWFTVNNWSKL